MIAVVVVKEEGVERTKVGSEFVCGPGGVGAAVGIGCAKVGLWKSKYGRRNKGHGRERIGCHEVIEVPKNDVDDEECGMAF
jgi:hypothetical protein